MAFTVNRNNEITEVLPFFKFKYKTSKNTEAIYKALKDHYRFETEKHLLKTENEILKKENESLRNFKKEIQNLLKDRNQLKIQFNGKNSKANYQPAD